MGDRGTDYVIPADDEKIPRPTESEGLAAAEFRINYTPSDIRTGSSASPTSSVWRSGRRKRSVTINADATSFYQDSETRR